MARRWAVAMGMGLALHGDLFVVVDVCCGQAGDVDGGFAVEVDRELFAGEDGFGVSARY